MPRGPKGERRPADAIGNPVMIGRIATGEIDELTTDVVALIDAEAAKVPMVRGPYKKQNAEISN
jgi:hypothetical protein